MSGISENSSKSGPLAMLFFTQYCAKVLKHVYTDLKSFPEPCKSVRWAKYFESAKIIDNKRSDGLDELLLSIFSDEDAQKEKSASHSYIRISKSAVKQVENPNKNWSALCYESMNWFLASYVEKRNSRLKFPKKRAVLYLQVWMFDATMNLHTAGSEILYLWKAGNWKVLIDCDFPDRTVQNDLDVQQGQSLRYFVQISALDPTSLPVYPSSCDYSHYPKT